MQSQMSPSNIFQWKREGIGICEKILRLVMVFCQLYLICGFIVRGAAFIGFEQFEYLVEWFVSLVFLLHLCNFYY